MIAECGFEQTNTGFIICDRDSVYTFICSDSEIPEWREALFESIRLSAARVISTWGSWNNEKAYLSLNISDGISIRQNRIDVNPIHCMYTTV